MNDHSSKGYTYIFLFLHLVLFLIFPNSGPYAHLPTAPRYNFKHFRHPPADSEGLRIKVMASRSRNISTWLSTDGTWLVQLQITQSKDQTALNRVQNLWAYPDLVWICMNLFRLSLDISQMTKPKNPMSKLPQSGYVYQHMWKTYYA